VCVDNNLYVFGGFDGVCCRNTLLILKTVTEQGRMRWETPKISGTPPPPINSHCALMLGSRMLVYGGWDRSVPFQELYFLDTRRMIWFRAFATGQFPEPRWSFAMALIERNNSAYLFSGWNGRVDFPGLHTLTCRHLEEEWQIYFDEGIAPHCFHCKNKINPDLPFVQLLCKIAFHGDCIPQHVNRCSSLGTDPITCSPDSSLPQSEPTMLLNYISDILSLEEHPISKNLNAFLHQFELQYGDNGKTINFSSDSVDVGGGLIKKIEVKLHRAINEVHAYIARLHELILAKFKLLDSQEGAAECSAALKFIIIPQLYHILFPLYVAANLKKDTHLQKKMEMISGITMEELHIKPIFRLSEEEKEEPEEEEYKWRSGAYSKALSVLNNLHSYKTPYHKLDCILLVRHLVNNAVLDYWKNKFTEDPELKQSIRTDDLILTADDLVSIFTFLIIKVRVKHIYSQFAFITDFLDGCFTIGDAAYSLTTLQVAIESIEEMVHYEKNQHNNTEYSLDMEWLNN